MTGHTYPDVTIVCGEMQFEDQSLDLDDKIRRKETATPLISPSEFV